MEFSVLTSFHVPRFMLDKYPDYEHQRLMEEIEMIKLADRLGFKYAWMSEHHFLTDYTNSGAPEMALAYLAAVTEQIHLGAAVFQIAPSTNHPVRTAERAAMMDHLTEGRFELGLGRGSSSREHQGFGIADSKLTYEMVDEIMPEFAKMWMQDEYSHEGKHFTVPPRNVLPKPYKKPHPPLWLAAANTGTFEKAARMGVGVLCFTPGPPETLAPLIEAYKKNVVNADPIGEYINDSVCCVTNVFCHEDAEYARRVMTEINSSHHVSQLFRYLDTFPRPAEIPAYPDLIPEPTMADMEASVAACQNAVGDPDDCARVLQKYVDIGCDQLGFNPTVGTTPPELFSASMELFSREVMPRFDKEPVQRTKLLRDAAGAAAVG